MTVNKYGFVLNWFVSIMRSICKSEHFEIDRQDFCPWQKFTFYVFCSFFLETRGLLARLKLIMKISHRIWNAVINDRRERINGFHSIIWMVLLFKRFIILFYLQLQRINTIRLQCRIQNTKYTSNSVKLPLIFGIGLRFFSLSRKWTIHLVEPKDFDRMLVIGQLSVIQEFLHHRLFWSIKQTFIS